MDVTLKEYEAAVSDPEKKDAMIEKVLANIKVLEDENGEKYEVIPLKDVVAVPSIIKPSPQMVEKGLRFRGCTDQALRDDDVLLISYPKTGTHWFANLLYYLRMTGPLEEKTSFQPLLLEMFPSQLIESLPSPRVIVTHHKPANIPADALKGRGKLILLFRNPKDSAVSQFYHFKKMLMMGEMKLSWNGFADGWMKGHIPPGGFFDYYNTWQKEISENKNIDVLRVHYEDMKKDGFSELRRMNDFLGLNHSDERLQQVLDKCSINNLRSDIETGKVKSPLVNKDGKSILYRKGVIGDWKNHFTVAQNETMDALIAEKLKDSIFKCQF